MKKISFLQLFLFIVCVICFITSLINLSGIFSTLSFLIFPEEEVGSLVYVYRNLFVNIPMFAVASSIGLLVFKKVLAEPGNNETD
ncbi:MULTISPECIES: hypothetical protein [unclassified Enterococcus]|jgi:hypothetical protein|uniref:hypothetical protein n=1 Tax=unclassified Enterococcus TaxID=2608891 RepID=UPI003D2C08E4